MAKEYYCYPREGFVPEVCTHEGLYLAHAQGTPFWLSEKGDVFIRYANRRWHRRIVDTCARKSYNTRTLNGVIRGKTYPGVTYKGVHYRVHILMALAWIGSIPAGWEVDHLNGNLSERYTTWSIGVPVQLAFSAKNVLFLAGIKAAFPLTNSWKQSAENAALSVFYPAYDNRVYEAYPLAASRNFAMYNEYRLALPKVQWWATAELSYKIPINKNSRTHNSYIVVGAYCDYCLSKYTPARSDAVSMITLTNTRDGFPLQRILTPVLEANRQGQKLVSQIALFDIGIKISYAISPYDASSQPKTTPCRCLGVWK